MSENLFAKLDDSLLSTLESKVWQERKETLDVIGRYLNAPTLPNGNYGPIFRAIIRVIATDKHMMVVIRAITVLSTLAKSLGTNFRPFAERAISTCFAKFKDSNSNILHTLRTTTNAIVDSMTLECALEHIEGAMNSSITGTRVEAVRLLAYSLCKNYPTSQLDSNRRVKILKPLLPHLFKCSEHRATECREASFQALAAVRIFLAYSENQFSNLTEGLLDEVRRVKVEAAYQVMHQKLMTEMGSASNKAATSESRLRSGKKRKHPVTDDEQVAVNPYRETPMRPSSKFVVQHTKTRIESTQRPESKKQQSRSVKASCKKKGTTNCRSKSNTLVPASTDLSYEEVQNRLRENYLASVQLDQLNASNWSARFETIKAIADLIKSNAPDDLEINYLLQFITRSGCIKDKNFRVRCEVLATLSRILSIPQTQSTVPALVYESLCEQLAKGISDTKSGALVIQVLNRLINLMGVNTMCEFILNNFHKQTSPSNQSAVVNWLVSVFRTLDSSFDHVVAVNLLKLALNTANVNTRDAAVELAGVLFTCLPNIDLRSYLSNERPAILKRLDAEFAKRKNEKEGVVVNHSEFSTSSDESTFDGPTVNTPAAMSAWSDRRSKNVTMLTSVSSLNRLTNAQGVLDFSDTDSSDTNDQSVVSYRKGVIKSISPQTSIPQADKAVASINGNESLFTVITNKMSDLLYNKQLRLLELGKLTSIDHDHLRGLFTECLANAKLLQNLFNTDANSHLEAIDQLTTSLSWSDQPNELSPLSITFAHFDLILLWLVEFCLTQCSLTRMDSTAKTLISRVHEYLSVAIFSFAKHDLRLSEAEVNVILVPLLNSQQLHVLATSSMNTNVHYVSCDVIRLLRQVYPTSRLLNMIANYMHRCGSTQMRHACLIELLDMMPKFGESCGYQFDGLLTLIAQQLADSDSNVRSAAMNCLRVAHECLGPQFWHFIGNVSEKDRQLLENQLTTKSQEEWDIATRELAPTVEMNYSIVHNTTNRLMNSWASIQRALSPLPVYESPAALTFLVPLIKQRDSPTSTESERNDAVEKLDFAINCLIDQFNANLRVSVSPRQNTMSFCDQHEEELSGFNNNLLGALVDLEALIQDPRTCCLLSSFVPRIVEQLALLAQRLCKTEVDTGFAIFTGCLVGVLVVLFVQPILLREVTPINLQILLASLFQLAQHSSLTIQSKDVACTSSRKLLILKVIHYINLKMKITNVLSCLIHLLSVCCNYPDELVAKAQTKSEALFTDMVESSSRHEIGELILMHLCSHLSRVKLSVNEIDWSVLSPYLELFIPRDSGLPTTTPQQRLYRKAALSLQRLIVDCYAAVGIKLLNEIIKYSDECPLLLSTVKRCSIKMPNAPYAHCVFSR